MLCDDAAPVMSLGTSNASDGYPPTPASFRAGCTSSTLRLLSMQVHFDNVAQTADAQVAMSAS